LNNASGPRVFETMTSWPRLIATSAIARDQASANDSYFHQDILPAGAFARRHWVSQSGAGL
jgi:hypothetical protein